MLVANARRNDDGYHAPARTPFSFSLVDLDQTRSEDCSFSHIICTCEWPRSFHNRRNGQPVHLVRSTWKVRAEADHAVTGLWVGYGFNDRQVLLVDVHNAVAVEVAGGGASYAELQGLVCGCGRWGRDAEEAEDGDVDCVDVGTGAIDDEVLVQRREGKSRRGGREERKSRWDLAEHGAVEAVLFAFLTL